MNWNARMGWHYVAYIDGDNILSLSIEPMVKEDDRVYVPNEENWLKKAPAWARERRSESLDKLKAVPWNRKITWQESSKSRFSRFGPDEVFPGSLESSRAGSKLEAMRLFEPDSNVSRDEAHKIWHDAARRFAEVAEGEFTLYIAELIPDSVVQVIQLPALKKNQKVTLVFK